MSVESALTREEKRLAQDLIARARLAQEKASREQARAQGNVETSRFTKRRSKRARDDAATHRAGKNPETELVKEIVAERPKRIYGHCPLCGFPCRSRACPEHWDVIKNDPHFQMKGTAA